MAAPLVDWHIGRMPLVITCPHDGRAEPPGVPERPDDQAGCLTKKQADLSTRTIALGLSSAVQALMGLEPSMVVARFHRRYIDANRPEKCAFVAREARPLYREYASVVVTVNAGVDPSLSLIRWMISRPRTRRFASVRARSIDTHRGRCPRRQALRRPRHEETRNVLA